MRISVPKTGKNVAIRVIPAAERQVREGHPWLFASSIRQQSHEGKEGDLAVIFDRKDRFLAIGIFDPYSPIRVRILHHNHPVKINQNWIYKQIDKAVHLRDSIDKKRTNGYRLLHGENDAFPGLVIDRYDQTVVIKLYTLAWLPYISMIVEAVFQHFEFERAVIRFGRLIQERALENYGLVDGGVVAGSEIDGVILFQENELVFEADVVNGQKTGFFLDQRENRERVEKLSDGMRVLNVFAYTGGFSLYAARGKAKEVVSLDLSGPALEAAERNFIRNQNLPSIASCEHRIIQGDAFDVLEKIASNGKLFDLVILDPPSFARRASQVQKALDAYHRLATLGLGVLRQNGILVSASCSSRIDAETFFTVVHRAADHANRPLSEIERTYHPIDHPIGFAEGAYLKCLFARAG